MLAARKQQAVFSVAQQSYLQAQSVTPSSAPGTCTTRKRFEFPPAPSTAESADRMRVFSVNILYLIQIVLIFVCKFIIQPSMRAYPPRSSAPFLKRIRSHTDNLVLDSINDYHQSTAGRTQTSTLRQRDWRTILTLEREKLNLLNINLQKDVVYLTEKQKRLQKKIKSYGENTHVM